MAISDSHITDPVLLSVLAAASTARAQSLELLDIIAASKNSSQDTDAVADSSRKLTARIAQLRGLNRKAIVSVRNTKQETTEARQEIDALHLVLQNLYYEQRHLRGEIRGCEGFDHKYQRLPMLAVEEFIEAHPDAAEMSEHDLTIARIEDEHRARQALEEQRLELVKKKEALVKDTNAKKDELGKLDMEVEKWVGGLDGVKGIFEAREKKERERLDKEIEKMEEESGT
ncbi:THO complex like protein [Zymoseptoria brevis]|uniref:THO complex like protein n=1 Tax=Zymoseptoria brevis TaxID=1047168 RepID=A0A0F4GEQ5_9PEZI|nr:THO complex like protein [Zymoseptoria brevis]